MKVFWKKKCPLFMSNDSVKLWSSWEMCPLNFCRCNWRKARDLLCNIRKISNWKAEGIRRSVNDRISDDLKSFRKKYKCLWRTLWNKYAAIENCLKCISAFSDTWLVCSLKWPLFLLKKKINHKKIFLNWKLWIVFFSCFHSLRTKE